MTCERRTPVSVPLTGMCAFTGMFSHRAGTWACTHNTQQAEACVPVVLQFLPPVCSAPEFVTASVCRFYVLLRHLLWRLCLQFLLSPVCATQRSNLPFFFLMSLQKLLQDLVSKSPPGLVTVFALVSLHLPVDSGSLSQPFIGHWMKPSTKSHGVKGPWCISLGPDTIGQAARPFSEVT